MKLSDKTVKVLQNFTTINQSLSFKSGNSLRTISPMQNVLAEAKIEEHIPKDFAIYDLPQFLNTLNLYDDPEVDVISNESYLTIKEGKFNRSKYFFSDPSVIIAPPDKEMELPSKEVTFTIQAIQLQKILKAAAILGLPDLSVVGGDGVIRLLVTDRKNQTSNDHSVVVGKTDANFSFNFKIENLKLITGTYQVTISEKKLSKFENENFNLTYYIALEPDSTYEG
tara:strand:+ start:29777 stop:30451 length:675 start_codon:yes stop_codon:yes gene_type:complete